MWCLHYALNIRRIDLRYQTLKLTHACPPSFVVLVTRINFSSICLCFIINISIGFGIINGTRLKLSIDYLRLHLLPTNSKISVEKQKISFSREDKILFCVFFRYHFYAHVCCMNSMLCRSWEMCAGENWLVEAAVQVRPHFLMTLC